MESSFQSFRQGNVSKIDSLAVSVVIKSHFEPSSEKNSMMAT